MLHNQQNKSNEQFFKLTLKNLLKLYKLGLFSVKGLVYSYFSIKIKKGWIIKKTPKELCEELGISKASLYRAIKTLKDDHLIDWDIPDSTEISFSLGQRFDDDNDVLSVLNQQISEYGQSQSCDYQSQFCDSQSQFCDSQSQSCDSQSQSCDSQSQFCDYQSQSWENESRKPLINKDFEQSPDLYSDCYQSFKDSLSEEEREKFLKFVKYQTSNLPKPIINMNDYLNSKDSTNTPRYKIYYQAFKDSQQVLKPSKQVLKSPSEEERLKCGMIVYTKEGEEIEVLEVYQVVIRGKRKNEEIDTFNIDSVSKEKPIIEEDNTDYVQLLGENFNMWLFNCITKSFKWITGMGEKITPEEKQLRLKFSLWVRNQQVLGNIHTINGVYRYDNPF